MEVLVVDDDMVDRAHIKRTLRRSDSNCNVVEAEDVDAAIQLLSTANFDVILLDYNMPKRNGLELLLEIKQKDIINNSAVIMMSTSEEECLAMECLHAGAQDFFAKSEISGYRLKRAILAAKTRLEMELKLKDSYLKVKRLAEQDNLTKLANRYLFDESLKKAIKNNNRRRQHKVALILFDLDHFKFVNDTHGHDVGDKLLKKVVKRVETALRETECFSRLGGDEFAIILNHITSISEVEKVALRILKTFDNAIVIGDATINIAASIGISIFPDNSNSASEIFKRADIAMYKAKNLGRNQIAFFEHKMQQQFLNRYKIESELKNVLQLGGLELYYQPILDGDNKTLCGFEALLRWQGAEGLIMPDEFIPIAEECKMISPIGRWVISQAIEQIYRWRQASGIDLSMSINLSPVQLLDSDLIPHIEHCLSKFNIPPNRIEFELTETALFDVSESTTNTINEISTLGCRIALDDFGTGYSSLSHLNSYPINTVKIDKSLISGGGMDVKLIKGVVAMLHSMELTIVAEGIETESQFSFCQQLNIHKIQGYLFSKPLSSVEIEKRYIEK